MSNEAPSRTNQSNQIRTACRELERALEVFNRTEPSATATDTMAASTASAPGSNQDTTQNQLKVIHEQLLDIRRQLDELS